MVVQLILVQFVFVRIQVGQQKKRSREIGFSFFVFCSRLPPAYRSASFLFPFLVFLPSDISFSMVGKNIAFEGKVLTEKFSDQTPYL